MSLFLVDDQGEMWRGDSRQLRIAFDTPFSGGEFIEYAIKNLGFVAINIYGASCEVRLRPGFVSAKTFRALLQFVEKATTERIVITSFDKGWQHQLVNHAQAAPRLEQVVQVAQAALSPTTTAFLSRPIESKTISSQPELGRIFENWNFLIENYDTDTILNVLRSLFAEKYVVVKRSTSNGKLVFQEIGDLIYTGSDTWRECAIGAPIEEQPDRSYGRWVSGAYYDAIGQQAPRQDAVDVIMRGPTTDRYRLCYRRLIFPLRVSSTEALMVGGSIRDRNIDLRIGSG